MSHWNIIQLKAFMGGVCLPSKRFSRIIFSLKADTTRATTQREFVRLPSNLESS